ncbi:MAG: NAD-dependent epimerase/dehydratase family protein [Alphaproteobacteria bacterium]
MRVLVTGGSGMTGSHLARRLVRNGHAVAVISRGTEWPVRLSDLRGALALLRADLEDREGTAAAVAASRPEVVFHLASTPFNPPPTSARHLAVNVLGTESLLAAAAACGVGRVVFTGTAAQYGAGAALAESDPERPATVLGATKSCAAVLLHAHGRLHGFSTVEARLFTPYGPWERPGRLVPHTVLSALDGRDVAMTGGAQERDFLHIDDVVEALVRTMTADLPPACVLNICSGRGIAVRDLVARILALMGDPVRMRAGALATRADEIMTLSGTPDKARTLLDWEPRLSLDEGLGRTIAWIRDNRDLAARLT